MAVRASWSLVTPTTRTGAAPSTPVASDERPCRAGRSSVPSATAESLPWGMDSKQDNLPKRRLLFVAKPPESEEGRKALADELAARIWAELHPGETAQGETDPETSST